MLKRKYTNRRGSSLRGRNRRFGTGKCLRRPVREWSYSDYEEYIRDNISFDDIWYVFSNDYDYDVTLDIHKNLTKDIAQKMERNFPGVNCTVEPPKPNSYDWDSPGFISNIVAFGLRKYIDGKDVEKIFDNMNIPYADYINDRMMGVDDYIYAGNNVNIVVFTGSEKEFSEWEDEFVDIQMDNVPDYTYY